VFPSGSSRVTGGCPVTAVNVVCLRSRVDWWRVALKTGLGRKLDGKDSISTRDIRRSCFFSGMSVANVGCRGHSATACYRGVPGRSATRSALISVGKSIPLDLETCVANTKCEVSVGAKTPGHLLDATRPHTLLAVCSRLHLTHD
jgi:hypothetical protein